MRQEIAKSPEILEKEALIKDSQSQLKKRKSILKGLKTRLENTKNQITDVQRSGSGQVILKFPINVQSRGKMEFKKGEKLKITKLAGYNEKVGLIVDVKYRNQLGTYPLFDLMPVAKDKDLRQIFNDYLIWVTDTYHL